MNRRRRRVLTLLRLGDARNRGVDGAFRRRADAIESCSLRRRALDAVKTERVGVSRLEGGGGARVGIVRVSERLFYRQRLRICKFPT